MSPGGSGGSQTLANLIVQFQLQGQQALKQGFDDIQTAISAVVLAVNKLNIDMTKALESAKTKTTEAKKTTVDLGEAFKRLGDQINISLGIGVGVIANFVRQGIAASSMGQLLGFQMERLSRTIAGLFRPEIEKVLSGIEKLTSWIHNLTDAQRASIARWIEAGAAALAVGLIFPRIVAGITAVSAAIKGLGVAIGILEGSTGIGALLPLIGLAIQGFTMLVVGTEGGRAALGAFWEGLKPLIKSLEHLGKVLGPEIESFMQNFGSNLMTLVPIIAKVAEAVSTLADSLDRLAGHKGTLGKIVGDLASTALGLSALRQIQDLFGVKRPEFKLGEKGDRGELPRRLGGFEGLGDTYRRIAQASRLAGGAAGKKPEELTAEAVTQSIPILGAIKSATEQTAARVGVAR